MSIKMSIKEKLQLSKDHLRETEWTYKQHLDHSFMQSGRLIKMAIKSYLHGIFPWMYKGDGPIGVYKMYKEIKRIQHVQKILADYDKANDVQK